MSQLQEIINELSVLESLLLPESTSDKRYLFRGESQVHEKVNSTLARIPKDDHDQLFQTQKLNRWVKYFGRGLFFEPPTYHDALGVLQHYGWPTPLIDLTGTLNTAVFFSLNGAIARQSSVIYVVDRLALPDEYKIVEHLFLADTLADGGLKSRWWRQDGYALSPSEQSLFDTESCRALDLRSSTFTQAVRSYEFVKERDDGYIGPNLYSKQGDPIPERLQSVIRINEDYLFVKPLCPALKEKVDNMFP